MKKTPKTYNVYYQIELETDEPEDGFETEWRFVDRTRAVSESQAINNVRHNTIGDISQYLPIAVGGHWTKWINWKAEIATEGTFEPFDDQLARYLENKPKTVKKQKQTADVQFHFTDLEEAL